MENLKLTGQEINALARQLAKEANKPVPYSTLEEGRKLMNDPLIKDYNRAAKALAKKYPNQRFIHILDASQCKNLLDSNNRQKAKPYVNERDVADMIILSQMDCKSLEELKKKILKQLGIK